MSKHQHEKVRSRNENFADRTSTRIWKEEACEDNPYISQSALCHGYDICELMEKCSFTEVFYLLFRGELPNSQEQKLLEALMIGLINPGPRHPATRAAMNAGVGKSFPVHILPIAMTVMGGDYLGGGEIEPAMRFLRKERKNAPQTVAHAYQHKNQIPPGFGQRFGGIDVFTHSLAEQLLSLDGPWEILEWSSQLAKELNKTDQGWLATGLAAAVFADLGFQPKSGGALFQLLAAPGLLAHGLELSNKPITAMPYVKDEDYVIEKQS